MVDGEAGRSGRAGGRFDVRRLAATLCAVLLFFTTTGAVLTYWANQALFDSGSFAARTTRLLDSDAVRAEVAEQLTDALVQNGPSQLAGFRALILPAAEDLVGTDAFRQVFRRAVEQAHRSLFTEDGTDMVVNLSQSLGILASSLQITNPEVAANIPTGLDELLVRVGDDIRAMELWRAAADLDELATGLFVGSFFLAVGAVALDRDLRRGAFKVGAALALGGLAVVGLTVVAPRIAGAPIEEPLLRSAIESGTTIFVADLRVLGMWMLGYGVVAAALATANAPRRDPLDPRVLLELARGWWERWQPATPGGQVARALAIVAVGIALVVARDLVVPLLVTLVGVYVAYVGVTHLLVVVGRRPADIALARATEDLRHPGRSRRVGWVAGAAVAVLGALSVAGLVGAHVARSRAAAASERTCNGHAELCDRTLDRVAFAGSHNSMSSSADPGWLFPEQSTGIPGQLAAGVRALLVKTHYGIPSGITYTGAELVVTDRAAELTANPDAVRSALPAGVTDAGAAEASSLAASASLDPSKRGIYLCHVYCEYGSTPFADALADIGRFLERNPGEVVILFIGDYVSADDTTQAFRSAGLLDRLHTYDPTQPPPTLGELVDSGRTLVVFSEFSGPPPGWNNPGYGLFQDTPYTFTDTTQLVVDPSTPGGTDEPTGQIDADTVVERDGGLASGTTMVWGDDWPGRPSCAPNRGSPDAPLFQINHWVTPAGAAPTVAQARTVNAHEVLMGRVRTCMAERGRFPTIVGVNFATTGDLFDVVDELNGVG